MKSGGLAKHSLPQDVASTSTDECALALDDGRLRLHIASICRGCNFPSALLKAYVGHFSPSLSWLNFDFSVPVGAGSAKASNDPGTLKVTSDKVWEYLQVGASFGQPTTWRSPNFEQLSVVQSIQSIRQRHGALPTFPQKHRGTSEQIAFLTPEIRDPQESSFTVSLSSSRTGEHVIICAEHAAGDQTIRYLDVIYFHASLGWS